VASLGKRSRGISVAKVLVEALGATNLSKMTRSDVRGATDRLLKDAEKSLGNDPPLRIALSEDFNSNLHLQNILEVISKQKVCLFCVTDR